MALIMAGGLLLSEVTPLFVLHFIIVSSRPASRILQIYYRVLRSGYRMLHPTYGSTDLLSPRTI